MPKAESRGFERRTARRYRVPGSARVFWGGDGAAVSIADMSSGGCLVIGRSLPEVGTRVFLSLDIGGLPNVRLPAVTVRCDHDGNESMAAVRFEVPAASVGGLDKLLAQTMRSEPAGLFVLLVDSDPRSRGRIADAVRSMGAEVHAVSTAKEAGKSRHSGLDVVLARADLEGLATLAAVSLELPTAFRVAYGRRPALASALTSGIAQASADDPCSAKCLSELLREGRLRTPS